MTAIQFRRSGRSPVWVGLVFGTSSTGVATDAGLVAIRAVLAWVFIYYGGGKLFGWFPGSGSGPQGIHQTSQYFAQVAGLRPGGFFAVLGGITEFGGGVVMALGLLSRLAGVALFADMVIAMITVTWSTGFASATAPPGYQLNVVVGALALAVALMGAGRLSADAVIARRLGSRNAVLG